MIGTDQERVDRRVVGAFRQLRVPKRASEIATHLAAVVGPWVGKTVNHRANEGAKHAAAFGDLSSAVGIGSGV